jgi:hypothetical protein
MLAPSHTPTPHFVSFSAFRKTIVYIAIRCIMNTKKLLVNTSRSKVSAPGSRQHAVAIRNITLPRKLRYRIRNDKTQIVAYMPVYRNTMYYGHKELFCQYPFDIGIWLDILHTCSGIKLSSCQSDQIRKCFSFHCWLSPTNTPKHQAAVFSSQTKTILQTYIHLSRASYIGDVIQITVRVRGLIVYSRMDDSFVHN